MTDIDLGLVPFPVAYALLNAAVERRQRLAEHTLDGDALRDMVSGETLLRRVLDIPTETSPADPGPHGFTDTEWWAMCERSWGSDGWHSGRSLASPSPLERVDGR